MDKKKALGKIATIKNSRGPSREHNDHLCDLLTEIINELPDYTFTCELRKKPTFWYTADKLNEKMPTISEMLAQHKRDMRKYEANRRIDSMLRKVMSLSFAEAIEILKRDRLPIKHETWRDGYILPSINSRGYVHYNGINTTSMFTVSEDIRHNGWIVLDK